MLKPNGRLLIIDFHPGTLKIPKGWFTKAFITLSEIAAGKEHFKNYQTYMKRGGLEEIYTLKRLRVKRSQVVSSGNMILMLLQKEVKFQ